jgi:molybdopterin biosynthesis enzyme
MNPPVEAPQRIPRLAPLSEIEAAIDRLASPLRPRLLPLAEAAGRVVAADIRASATLPTAAIALRDGWAVRADLVADAGPYAPVPLMPRPTWVDVGALMPAGTDAVLPPDAMGLSGGLEEALASVSPGEGTLAAAADTAPGDLLCAAGALLRPLDLAVLRAAGLAELAVRVPRVAVVIARADITAQDDLVGPWLAALLAAGGAVPLLLRTADAADALRHACLDEHVDLVVAVGGTGEGRDDGTVRLLARLGRLDLHGMGIQPGSTAALGAVGPRPVLLLPGRLDAALAAWLLVGRLLLARLTGAGAHPRSREGRLARKIVSTVGLAEAVLVRAGPDGIEPLAAGSFPLRALAAADAWVRVPPESEGYPAGATVTLEPLS